MHHDIVSPAMDINGSTEHSDSGGKTDQKTGPSDSPQELIDITSFIGPSAVSLQTALCLVVRMGLVPLSPAVRPNDKS